MKKLLVSAIALGLAMPAAAQEQAEEVQKVRPPAPPPIRTVKAPPPVPVIPPPPPIMRMSGFPSLEAEVARFGAAPTYSGAWPTDKKEVKAFRRERESQRSVCTKRDSVAWSLADKKLAACDALLGGPEPEDAPTTRGFLSVDRALDENEAAAARAELLQGRALALLALDANRLAIAAADEADEWGVQANNSLYELSGGLANQMIRTFALVRLGEKDEAQAAIDALRAARPYSTSIAIVANNLQSALNKNDLEVQREQLYARIPLDPDVQQMAFLMDLMSGRLEAADSLGDAMSFTKPKMRGGWTVQGDAQPWEKLDVEVTFQGLRAYTAAALGNAEKSEAILAETRLMIDDYRGPDPRESDARKIRKKKVNEYLARSETASKVTADLATIMSAVPVRETNKGKPFDEIASNLRELGGMNVLLPVLVEQLRLAGGDDAEMAAKRADALVARFIRVGSEIKPAQFGAMLPTTEFLNAVPDFSSTASKWLFGGNSGWSKAEEKGTDIMTVRYETTKGSKPMMEEMLLIAAAGIARDKGKDAFVILSNRTFKRYTTTTSYYGGSWTSDSGFESQARIQLIDSANPPALFASTPERIILASDIEANLMPRFDEYFAKKEARKKR